MRKKSKIDLDNYKIKDFCQRWEITELAFFGSILRDDHTKDSDIDVLLTYSPGVSWGLFKAVRMEAELSEILGRKVDLISRRAVERSQNWVRRKEIISNCETFYVAG